VEGSATAKIKEHDGLIELSLKKGEEVTIYVGKRPESFAINALQLPNVQRNFWGVQVK
jgi:hypothetical protein